MRAHSLSIAAVLIAFAIGCRSGEQSTPESNVASDEPEVAAGAEPEAAAEAPRPPNSAEGISAITRELPLYPGAKPKIPTTWTAAGEFDQGKWGATYEANTGDTMEKVLDWYEKELGTRGWTGKRLFKGMIAFDKKSAPRKLVTLVSGDDDRVPGQTLIRVLVVDE